jgi:hypothetical protein
MNLSLAHKQFVDLELTAFCERRGSQHVQDKVRVVYRWNRNNILLIEQRAMRDDPSTWVENPIVMFRYDETKGDWELRWLDRSQRWRSYDMLPNTHSITRLLMEVDRDPTGVFWGYRGC